MRKRALLLLTTILTTYNLVSQGYSNEFERTFVNDGEYIKYFDKSVKSIEGSPFLFKNFNNTGVLFLSKEKNYKINNINIDLINNKFISKISKDSVLVYNGVNVVSINNLKFERFEDKIYQILFKQSNKAFYKLYEKKIKKAQIHRMSGAIIKPERYVNILKYFYREGETITSFKLKKKSILSLFKTKTKTIKNYVKKNKLSYKNEKDMIELFKYLTKL